MIWIESGPEVPGFCISWKSLQPHFDFQYAGLKEIG